MSEATTTTEIDLMLASHRARLFVLQTKLATTWHENTTWYQIECEIGRLEASIDRLRRAPRRVLAPIASSG